MCVKKMWIFVSLLLIWIISFGFNFGEVSNVRDLKYQHLYKPLRITPFYQDLELNRDDVKMLKDAVHNVVLYIKKILSVIPLNDPLLLERDACKSSWIHGRNVGKCASIKKGYSGEYCIDNFNIPEEHLGGFYTWTNRALPGKTWFMEGNGVKNTDFLLYVRALTTQSCRSNFREETDNSLIAYASFCKLGKNDRPLAGYMNFCPTELTKLKNDTNKLILTTMHEIFHALGFSKDLFLKYRDCSRAHSANDCPCWDFPIIREQDDQKLLLTPEVVYQMQKHFDCDKGDFGGPLLSQDGILQSHWDEKILPGSIMTSHLGKPEYTFVDPITLAVFQDSGWYLVNFSNAENYVWRKGKGCDFFSEQHALHSDQSDCSADTAGTRCNYLHTLIVKKCKQNRIEDIESNIVKDCRHLNNNTDKFNEMHAKRNEFGRCLLSYMTYSKDRSYSVNERFQGICVNIKCFKNGEVWIKLNSPNWVKCPFGQKVEVDSFQGFISCPESSEIVCGHRGTPLYLQDLYLIETTSVIQRTVPVIPNTSPSYSVNSLNRHNRKNSTHKNFQMSTHVLLLILTIISTIFCNV